MKSLFSTTKVVSLIPAHGEVHSIQYFCDIVSVYGKFDVFLLSLRSV
jgi:hypothetical protein